MSEFLRLYEEKAVSDHKLVTKFSPYLQKDEEDLVSLTKDQSVIELIKRQVNIEIEFKKQAHKAKK